MHVPGYAQTFPQALPLGQELPFESQLTVPLVEGGHQPALLGEIPSGQQRQRHECDVAGYELRDGARPVRPGHQLDRETPGHGTRGHGTVGAGNESRAGPVCRPQQDHERGARQGGEEQRSQEGGHRQPYRERHHGPDGQREDRQDPGLPGPGHDRGVRRDHGRGGEKPFHGARLWRGTSGSAMHFRQEKRRLSSVVGDRAHT